MEHDYYQILGIPPTSDLDAIKTAFRRKVMECHPDRGGSHAKMVLVNEAWEVLSDPDRRSRYDAARTHAGDRAAQEAAAADARRAHQRAQQYPERWEEMEGWLNSKLAKDFTDAEYGSFQLGIFHIPTAGISTTGWGFILAGAGIGYLFLSSSFYEFGKWVGLGDWQVLALSVAPAIGGAWAANSLHQWIGLAIKGARDGAVQPQQQEQHEQRKQPAVSSQAQATALPQKPQSLPQQPQQARVIECVRCGQKLRVPAMKAEILVTCKSCGHKFACPPPEGKAIT